MVMSALARRSARVVDKFSSKKLSVSSRDGESSMGVEACMAMFVFLKGCKNYVCK